jgi:hypothetical protein
MVRTQIQLTEKQARILKQMAAEKSVSMANLIRQAIDTLLKSSNEVDYGERKHRAIKAAGKFHSGLGDLSENHDNYLDEDYE